MKSADVDKIHAAGLITDEQRVAIIARFKLDDQSNKLLVILSIVGAVLVGSGIILLIASNWETIPRFVKLVMGLALLVGAHAGGWFLGRAGGHPQVAEALHLLGLFMFLANIALVGQIYHLSSRPPNAILLWLVGIVPLPWILRSRAQHILTLAVFALWLGLELNQRDSLIYFDGEARQAIFFVMVGVLLAGLGTMLSRSRFPEFGPATEKLGILMLYIASYPLTIAWFYGSQPVTLAASVLCGSVTALAVILLVVNASDSRVIPDRQWRWTWAAAQAGVLALAWLGLTQNSGSYADSNPLSGAHWVALPGLFLFGMLQAQVGLLRRSVWFVNVAVAFIGLYIITAYFQLFGSMQTTGMMFVVTGVFLIGLAIYLERQRRAFLKRMREPVG